MLVNQWEQEIMAGMQVIKSLIYCQEFIYLDDNSVLGVVDLPSTTQHGFKTNLYKNNWNNSIMQNKWNFAILKNSYIVKEV